MLSMNELIQQLQDIKEASCMPETLCRMEFQENESGEKTIARA